MASVRAPVAGCRGRVVAPIGVRRERRRIARAGAASWCEVPVLILRGRAALSAARRARALARAAEGQGGAALRALDTRWVHLVVTARPLDAAEAAQLDHMLAYGPRVEPMAPGGDGGERAELWVTPRIGTVSPWSSKATDIAHVCGLVAVTRIERAIEYRLGGERLDAAAIGRALADRMTESVVLREADLAAVVRGGGAPRPLGFVALGGDPAATLRAASTRLGLALADDEIAYLVARYRELGRDPTDVELMMFAQANSEHCRHKIFNAEIQLAGVAQDRSLFQLIKQTTEASPAGVLSAYRDNAAVVEGSLAERLFPDAAGVYRAQREPVHVLGKVETHNHPTAISPFPGAATGSGGEIRDEGATGRGAKPKAGLVGFTVSDLRLPGALEPWEPPAADWIGRPARIASALDIMTDGPLGAAAFNNEFGRPAIAGYFRTYERAEPAAPPSRDGDDRDAGGGRTSGGSGEDDRDAGGGRTSGGSGEDYRRGAVSGGSGEDYRRGAVGAGAGGGGRVARGYHKPVMLAGGIGAIRGEHVHKAAVPDGAALIVLGGPAFLIGLGGGAASSLAQGASAEDVDFASVQRDNAEIQRRCQEVIDRCWALGERNPILSIHDVGAGGLSNALPELVHDAGLGARLELRAIPTGEADLSPLELWCNEAQERYVLAIATDRVSEFAALCARERAPWAQLGSAAGDRRLVLSDARGGPPPVDLPLEVVLGKPPRMVRRIEPLSAPRTALELGGATVAEALDRVLGLPAVADKSFLVTIGDRTVGGLIARDPMIGRFQVPVADCALTTAGFDTTAGEVIALGERPPVALLDAAAASRLAIAEAITNLAGAPIGALGRIKLSCNWMAAAGHPGEDARLYDAVRAASACAIALGLAIPVGKDSMSMRTVWDGPSASAALTPVTAGLARGELKTTVAADPSGAARDRALASSAEAAIDRAVAAADSLAARVAGGPRSFAARGAPGASSLAADGADGPPALIGIAPPALGAQQVAPRVTCAVVAPVTLVVTAFGPVDDVRAAVTPELRGGDRVLLLVDLGAGRGRLGGSCLAQVYGQLGDTPPDLDDPRRLAGFYAAIQQLVAARRLTAYHDRSDGGLVVSALEMAFASGLGLELDVSSVHADPFAALFAEELGALVEVARDRAGEVTAALVAAGAEVHPIGRAVPGDRIHIVHAGRAVVDASRTALRARWSHVSHQIALRRDDPTCAAEEHAARLEPDDPGLTAELTFAIPDHIPAGAPAITGAARPRVAVLRDQGVNGHIEMAAAFIAAGFDALDIHMTDLVDGRADLTDCRGLVACGGFSFGDVLGAGRGWAATFRYNPRARDALARFTARSDTFALGVCNGCQMLADLADQLPGAAAWPRFVRNRSERFEARLSLLRVDTSPSILFRGMAGSRIPIAVAHGEGRADLTPDQLASLDRAGLVAARFVDHRGAVATRYPANPNGSPGGVAALTTADGRFTIMMPHPERVHRTVQLSWHPDAWGEPSPWMQLFHNARAWVA